MHTFFSSPSGRRCVGSSGRLRVSVAGCQLSGHLWASRAVRAPSFCTGLAVTCSVLPPCHQTVQAGAQSKTELLHHTKSAGPVHLPLESARKQGLYFVNQNRGANCMRIAQANATCSARLSGRAARTRRVASKRRAHAHHIPPLFSGLHAPPCRDSYPIYHPGAPCQP